MRNRISFLIMYIAFFMYSFTFVLSKLASKVNVMSGNYILIMLGIILILGLYAILWQKILKYIDLSVAMAHKPVVIVLSVIWASLFFKEGITLNLIIGVFLIITGIIIMGGGKSE